MFDFIDHKEKINLLYGFFFASLQDDTLVGKNWTASCTNQMVYACILTHHMWFKVPHIIFPYLF